MTTRVTLSTFVDRATSPKLTQPDFAALLTLAEIVNKSPDSVCLEALFHLRRRLKVSSYATKLRAVEAVDILLKNCRRAAPLCFHRDANVAQRLAEIATKKRDPLKAARTAVTDAALGVIEAAAKSFRETVPHWENLYMLLRRKGVDFPGAESYAPPGSAPSRGQPQTEPMYAPHYPRQQQQLPPGYRGPMVVQQVRGHGQQVQHPPSAKEAANLVLEMRSQVDLANEMLGAAGPKEDVSTNDVLLDIVSNCRRDLPQLRAHLESGRVAESDLGALLSLNDDVSSLLKNFDARLGDGEPGGSSSGGVARSRDATGNLDPEQPVTKHRSRSKPKPVRKGSSGTVERKHRSRSGTNERRHRDIMRDSFDVRGGEDSDGIENDNKVAVPLPSTNPAAAGAEGPAIGGYEGSLHAVDLLFDWPAAAEQHDPAAESAAIDSFANAFMSLGTNTNQSVTSTSLEPMSPTAPPLSPRSQARQGEQLAADTGFMSGFNPRGDSGTPERGPGDSGANTGVDLLGGLDLFGAGAPMGPPPADPPLFFAPAGQEQPGSAFNPFGEVPSSSAAVASSPPAAQSSNSFNPFD